MAAFRLTTIKWVYLIVALFVAIILSLVLWFEFQANAFIAVRLHTGGQGFWAKAQKDAVRGLEHYARSHDEVDFQAYQRHIQVPLGDQQARLELQKPHPDLDVVRAGYLQGRNHPEDIEYAIPFFLRFQHNAHVARVIGHWEEADRLIAELNRVAERFHEAQSSGRAPPETARVFLAELAEMDRRLSAEEELFASSLAEAARWFNNASKNFTYVIALLFMALGLGLARLIITRIRVTERALAASEEQFRTIFEQVGDIIYTVEPDGTFSAISPSCERMLGWKPEEWLGRPFSLVVHPDDLPLMQALYLKAQAGEVTPMFQVRVLTKTGEYVASEIAMNLVRRGDSFISLGVMRDITERKRAEMALRESRDLLLSVVEHVPARIFWKDRDLRYLGCNTQFAKDAGHASPDELIGKTDFEMGWKDQAELYRADDMATMASGQPKLDYEEPQTSPDGKTIWLRTSKVPLRGADQQVIGLLGLYQDITEQKHADEAIRKSEARYRSYIEVTSQLAWVTNADGEVEEDLPTWRSFTGHSEEQVKGSGWIEAVHPDDRERAAQAWREAVARKGTYEVEYRMRRNDGVYRDFFTRGVPVLDASGGVLEWVGTSIDITELKQAGQALHEKQAGLDLALQSARMGTWYFDIGENRRYFDAQVCHLLGLDPATFAGTAEEFFGAIHPDDREKIKTGLARTIGQDVPYEVDYRAVWPDGSIHDITARGQLVRNGQGQPAKVRGIIWDITDRKQADQALREREDMLSKMMGSAQDAILILDNNGNIALWNAAAEKIFGYSNQEALGKNLHLLLAPSRFHEAHRAAFDRFRSTGEGAVVGKTLELAALRKDGTEFPMELSLSALKLKDQWHAVGFVRDITERKKSEAGVKLFQTLLDQSTDAIEVLDPDTLHFLDVNQAAYRSLGYSREELLSMSPFDIDPMLDRSKLTEITQELKKLRFSVNESLHRRKDGSEFPVEISITYVQLDRDYMIAVVRDISTRKQAERALERATRALRTLSACNEALVRDENEAELLASICRLIVDPGGYRMAWVGFPEQDPAKTVRPVAHSGDERGYLTSMKFSWADNEFGHGPTGMAIRTGAVQINRNFQTNLALAPWREAAQQNGYLASIALPLLSSVGTLGVLTIYASELEAFDEAEVKLLQELAGDLAFGLETLRMRAEHDRSADENLHHSETLRQSLEDSIKAIASTVEMRDPYTAGHQRRVGQLAAAIARELGLPENTIRGLELAASIHDLGKISVPAEILAKPSKLTTIETMLLKNHAQAGYDILKDIKFPWPIATMVWQHHERMDGSGYPQGLKGDAILLESRILAVADVVEAMASHRPYRAALGVDTALKELEQGRGTIYDATVVDACLRLFSQALFEFST